MFRSCGYQGSDAVINCAADARDSCHLFNRLKEAVLLPVVYYRLRPDRPNARQGFQQFTGGRVEIYQAFAVC